MTHASATNGLVFKLATACAALVLIFAAIVIWQTLGRWYFGSTEVAYATLTEGDDTSIGAIAQIVERALEWLFLSAIATAAFVLFGWRNERRRLKLQIQKLEDQVAQLTRAVPN